MIEVKENFLKQDVFDLIKNKINSTEFSWFYQHEQVKQDGFFFLHSLYNHDLSNSMFYEFIITPFKNKIKYQTLINCCVNLLLPDKNKKSSYHCDIENDKVTTAIFYVNTNNGYTEFEKGEKIMCKENTLIEFNALNKHRAVCQDDKDRRMVINFNYVK